MNERRSNVGPAVFVALLAIGVLLDSGCGGPVPEQARKGLEVTAETAAQIDRELAEEVVTRADECAAQTTGIHDWLECMRPHRKAVQSLQGLFPALRAVEKGLDAWDRGAGPGDFCGSVERAVQAIADLLDVLPAVGISGGAGLAEGARMLANIAAGYCDAIREDI